MAHRNVSQMSKVGMIFFALLVAVAPAGMAARLADFDQQFLQEVQRNHQTVSHKAGLVLTINRLLDCSATGRIDVALIGLNEAPEWVVETWMRHEPEAKEVSLSRYRMILNAGKPQSRTDFYRFRTIRSDGCVSEILYQNLPREKRAALIFQFENGDPTGQFKHLASVLEDLLACVEEGSFTVEKVAFTDVPQRVHDLWHRHVVPDLQDRPVLAQEFTANTPGGIETYWRLSASIPESAHEQTLLIYRDQVVFDIVDDTVKTF